MGVIDPYAGRNGGLLGTIADVAFGERRVLPTEARMYLRAMAGVETSPTADDFTDAELDAIIALSHGADDRGNVTYQSYAKARPMPGDPAGRGYTDMFEAVPDGSVLGPWFDRHGQGGSAMGTIGTTLGQFNVAETPDGQLRVRDVYNFNNDPNAEVHPNNRIRNIIADMIRGEASVYDLARNVGRVFGPQGSTTPGKDDAGMPIDFTFPKQYSWDRDR